MSAVDRSESGAEPSKETKMAVISGHVGKTVLTLLVFLPCFSTPELDEKSKHGVLCWLRCFTASSLKHP